MHKRYLVPFVCFLMLFFDMPVFAASKKITVLVMPFENTTVFRSSNSANFPPHGDNPYKDINSAFDQYAELPRYLIRDLLVDIGIDAISPAEIDYYGRKYVTGLRNSVASLKIAKELGANMIVIGSVDAITQRKNTTTTDGRLVDSVSVSMILSVNVVDANTKLIIFSKEINGTDEIKNASYINPADISMFYRTVKNAMFTLRENNLFLASLTTSNNRENSKIIVNFTPTPERCDIFINNKFSGVSPITTLLSPNEKYHFKVVKTGYKTWERELEPYSTISVAPELVRE